MAEADPVSPVSPANPASPYISPLRTNDFIRDRAVEAVLGQSGIHHKGLVAEIRRRFGSSDVKTGALVREPLIEGSAPFKIDGRTFQDCSGSLLHPDVIRAIASDSAGQYRFPPDAQPYQHQIAAWEHLTADERRSVLVSSGTGSGKTECFLMPLLHDLATEAEHEGRLSGVRALALYPLNALIASQQERLRAWTSPFNGKIRFGLYNGMTPEIVRARDQMHPEQVLDRATLRSDPPPILVTNVTMLEYMTVRRVDRPLIENSYGQLRWIILDEAHGYVGSGAAEIALLIRRVLLTFGVRAEDVRFVATSATIGEGRDVTDELRRFLRDLSGADESRVHIVTGERENILLPPPAASSALDMTAIYDRDQVGASPAVQGFIRAVEARPLHLEEAAALLRPTGLPTETVICAVAAEHDRQRGPLLPMRVHSFLRAVPGVWSCINAACADAPAGWGFGTIAVERIDACPTCASAVLEVMICRECGEPYLDCEEQDGHLRQRVTPPTLDEFAILREREIAGEDEDSEDTNADDQFDALRRILPSRPLGRGGRKAHIDPLTGRVYDRGEEGTIAVALHNPDRCDACQAHSGATGAVLRPLRFGAPFLIGNAAPVLLEGLRVQPDAKWSVRPPVDGRQLLSFTDSRQGTARFAANLQANAERGYVRGYIYHAVQGSMVAQGEDDPKVVSLSAEIMQLEAVGSPALAELIANKKAERAALLTPSLAGKSWTDVRDALARQPEVEEWMTKIWGPRAPDRYGKSPISFAEFLLLREFNRRPRRGNTVETMGLARLRFDQIDRAVTVPEALRARGRSVADWQGLLYAIIDMTVRGNFAIRLNREDLHWLHTKKPLTTLLPPGQAAQAANEKPWPMLGKEKRSASNLIMILEQTLGLDRGDPHGRSQLNEVLDSAWQALQPLFRDSSAPGYALDFSNARIAPVVEAWRCPVTGRVLPTTALGRTYYGHREGLSTSILPPLPLVFPQLPVTFPQENQIEAIRTWLATDVQVAALREQGVWANLHDRVAMLSPYLRAAEHSAQQPPARLRRLEAEFKRGEINILNCSTTMEMGVDIGSVSAVMMTNVPPALANYRQRVGRAGRRRQGFASSLTYTRDTPLDREAFWSPQIYLARETQAPRVKLDSRRIVQRHVNALLLAQWFAGEGGEALRTRAGDFFGCPGEIGAARAEQAPVDRCKMWLTASSTLDRLSGDIAALTRGTVLEGDKRLFEATVDAISVAATGFEHEWSMMQAQAAAVPVVEKTAIRYQLDRLARENLLKELAVRGVLPGHGFPTAVVPFVNSDKPCADERPDDDDAAHSRRSFPTRNLDIAIRDYAPGAEVVVNGLVYRSAGVTLNWLRPADDDKAKEIQSIKTFWTCPACGAADCGHIVPEHCTACHHEIGFEAQRRYLEPAGFTADMREQPHADTDDVSYVEPEVEQIVARGAAWQPFADPAQGRLRTSSEGLVFYSSRGPSKSGYDICLDCGRAAPAGAPKGPPPLQDHVPLRFTKANAAGLCTGNDKPFKVVRQIALGHETTTDVAELQPSGLASEGAAWAAVSALREALARQLGIEAGELGMAVRPAAGLLGERTHSLFLFDRASGGAGFAPQVEPLFDAVMAEARAILRCKQPGCETGCSACVLTADLQGRQGIVDRKGALAWLDRMSSALSTVSDDDRAAPDARLSRSVFDEIGDAVERGVKRVTIWGDTALDIAMLNSAAMQRLARRIADRGATLDLAVDGDWFDTLDMAARLALRDSAKVHPFTLRRGSAPRLANGAVMIAATGGGASATAWATCDGMAPVIGPHWGQGVNRPVVAFSAPTLPLMPSVDLDTLLPLSGTNFIEIGDQLDGTIAAFGPAFAKLLEPAIRAASGAGTLERIAYTDRYLQSPLVIRLMAEGLAALRDHLAGPGMVIPVVITTNRFKANDRQPFAPDHDWQWAEDRRDVLLALVERQAFAVDLNETGADHARALTLTFTGGQVVRIVLDSGFGPWRTPRFARFDFGAEVAKQVRDIAQYSAMIAAKGASYAVVTN